MPHLRSFAFLLAALAVAPAPAARADDGTTAPAAATATAAASPGVVRIDIEETIEGKPSRENLAAFFIRKKLREAGYKAWSSRPIRADEFEKNASPEANAKPDPDFVLKGNVRVDVSSVSTFYGQNLAFAYDGAGDFQLVDKAGKVLEKIKDSDAWSQAEQAKARDECLKRIAVFLAADVVKSDTIRSRLSEKAKAAVDAFRADLDKKRHQNDDQPPPANPVPGEGGGKKGRGGK